MPFVIFWYWSYSLVELLLRLAAVILWTSSLNSLVLSELMLYLPLILSRISDSIVRMFLKHGIAIEETVPAGLKIEFYEVSIIVCYSAIIFIRFMNSSMCFRTSIKPLINRLSKYSYIGESIPPMTSKYSCVNLKGADSKPMLPGEF